MGMLDDIIAKFYSNPRVNQPPATQATPPATVGSLAGAQQQPQMGGMSGDAQIDLQLRPMYLKYALGQQEQGAQAMPYDQWKAAYIQAMQGQR